MTSPKNLKKRFDSPTDVIVSRKTARTSNIGEVYFDFELNKLRYKRGVNDTIDVCGSVPTPPVEKKYVAILNAGPESAPTATVIVNTLGGDVTFARSSAGVYSCMSEGLFTVDKTTVIISGSPLYLMRGPKIVQPFLYEDASEFEISQMSLNPITLTDNVDEMYQVQIEITVYP